MKNTEKVLYYCERKWQTRDEMGRDYFVRVVYGTKVSLIVGIFAALLVLIIGVVYPEFAT